MSIRCYSELIRLPTFEERFEYLKLGGIVGEETFGFDRYINQMLYSRSQEWKSIRDQVIIRDNGCDLGIDDRPIYGRVIIHHMIPLRKKDILEMNRYVMNPEYLICVAHNTHNAIHYGNSELLVKDPVIRKPGDTCPWR